MSTETSDGTPRVSALYLYPVKACRGVSVPRWELDRYGLRFDRALMIVDAEGRAVTQREEPRLALVETALDAEALELRVPGLGSVRVPHAEAGVPRAVRVWKYAGEARDLGEAPARLLSAHLGRALSLVRMAPDHRRRVNPERTRFEAHTAFTDGYPLLVLGEAALAELNRRLPAPVGIERFRPNLVFSGGAPHAEDGWRRIRIGGIDLDLCKPCERCVVTTVDPARGARESSEPLRTLARYRAVRGAVYFGQNAVHAQTGALEIGAPIEVQETQSA